MKRLVPIGGLLLSALLAVAFAGALPAAVQQERAGRENYVKAICEPALHPTPLGPTLADSALSAPDFSLKDYAGREVSLSSLRGRVVLLNFWATWCPTCVEEMPSLERLAAAQQGKPVSLVAVSVDEGWDKVRSFFADGTKLTVLLDADKATPTRYGTEKFPETFIIDKEGHARFYVVSDRDWSAPDVMACIQALSES